MPQVLQPSCSLPRPTDHAQGKLTKPQHTEARSECMVQGLHQGSAHPDGSFSHGSQQENSSGLEDQPFPSSPQFTVVAAKRTPSEVNWNMAMNAQEPCHLEKNQSSDMQFVPSSLQTPAQSSTEDQAMRIGRDQSLLVGCPSQPKSLQLLKPPVLNSLAPPPDSESSPSRTPTCKKSPVVTQCNSAKLQPTSGQASLDPNLKVSKLRPPSTSFKQKQTSIPNPRPEPQNFQAKTSIPRTLARQKEIMQNPNGSLHSGDCLASNRYSRLPKPKIH